jgi:glutaredoxin
MNVSRYILAFVITAAIFGTAFYITSRLDAQRVADIRSAEDTLSIDLLSTQTQFELLGSLDCSALGSQPILSDELNSLAARLSVAEQNLGTNNAAVIQLKEQYSLLEIRDYLLLQQISQKCKNIKPVYILYFYSNSGDCPDCSRAGDVLTYLRQTYPDLRVYSFDYHLDLSALQTLIHLKKVSDTLPGFIVNNRAPVYGFKTLEEMQTLVPELTTLATSTEATSTSAR